jgi:hypothetical protein
MKFYSDIQGNLSIMHRHKALSFIDGVLDTEDNALIERLIAAGFRHDAPDVERTRAEIMAELDALGIKYDKRMNKAKLTELLGGA